MPVYPKAAPPSRVVRGEEPQGLFRAVKGAFHDLVSSSCTSGKNGTGGGRWNPARPPPRNHSSNLEGSGRGGGIPHEPNVLGGPGKHSRHLWVWLGQRYHTRRGQRSRVVIPGERGLALRCSDRHLVIRGGTEGNGWGTPLSRGPSPNQRYPRRLRSAWGVRTSTWGSPHRNPQITSDSTGCCAAPFCARTNTRSRQRQRDPAMFDMSLLRNSEMVMSPQEEHEPSTKASSACWMPRHVRQWSWPSWGARDRPHPETHGW